MLMLMYFDFDGKPPESELDYARDRFVARCPNATPTLLLVRAANAVRFDGVDLDARGLELRVDTLVTPAGFALAEEERAP